MKKNLLIVGAIWLMAGLLMPKNSSALEAIKLLRHREVPMRDGVKLYADVYLPRAEGRYPVLVVRTPYGVQRDGVHETMMKFAQRGYAVVMNDTRGRYESEGKWEPFRTEAEDGYDTIEWAAKQPWSNGKVATQGGSYLGHVQWAAGKLQPPSLVAMFPALASTNIYRDWITLNGAWRLSFNYGWGVVRMPNRIMLPQYWHSESYSPPELKYETILKHLPLKDGDLESAGYAVRHYRDWVAHPDYDAYWKAISDEENFGKYNVPIHTSGGWFDIFLQGTINGFVGARKHGANEKTRRESRMIIGAWGHGPTQKYGDVDFGPANNRVQFETESKWFDHYLLGKDTGIDREPPVEIFYMGVNQWQHEQDWPIPGTKFTQLYIAGGGAANTATGNGTLSFKPAAGAPSDTYRYDPNDPVPTLGGNNCCGTPTPAGPKDQRPLAARKDILVYNSEPMTEPLAIAGPVKMKLFAATDGPDTDWVVKLIDVAPNGFAFNVCEGILRARYRKGVDKPELLKAGEVYEYEVDLVGTANVFLPGHRIRVDITSSHFPQFDRNPNTGEPFGTSAKVRVAQQTVFHSAERASHILLPVVPMPKKSSIH
ncbi:MAG TPA: CocE/NonD family hydrolase [Blastocatellia bacterium]|nr:CocE/NonD family hydrolase [Blastocatellia bacterium]HMX24525.1 CocE/NonD family hydrolase [Blastocatellia bacterium]HMY71616.1 CocE/NonD family hydrolase [Blastocatellia bacterium]HMZ18943.1 CocE/NonD family hydrolase [Blastocatellia bacterium]HNG32428.1 CocE/NonD family hydrolase [Blastocatellia bacterium]